MVVGRSNGGYIASSVQRPLRGGSASLRTTAYCVQRMNRPFKVMVSIVTLVAFIANIISYDVAWAARTPLGLSPDGSKRADGPGFIKELHPDTFTLPGYLGRVNDSWSPSNDPTIKRSNHPTIVHIQDAHCNYAAQHKIAEIIEYLNKEYGVNTINLEGGAKDYDLSVFTNIADKTIRDKVADYFVKEGLVNGAEYFAVNNPEKVNLWGIEDTALYIENLKVYRGSLAYKDEIEKHLKALNHILSNLKTKIYSKELVDFDMKYGAYKAGNLDFKDYLKYLISFTRRAHLSVPYSAVDRRSFPSIYLLNQTLEDEGAIDFKKANNERDALIDALQKKISKSAIEELVIKTVDFKGERISSRDFYAYLTTKAKQANLKLDDYPALQKYIVYVSMYDAIDKSGVMEEMETLEGSIRGALCQNDDERKLCVLSKNLSLLKNIFNISLTKEDYAYYKANEGSFDVTAFFAFIDTECPKYNITARPDDTITNLDRYREDISKFYECSLKRDAAFVRNMNFEGSGVRGQGSRARYLHTPHPTPHTTILITGGFHTENLTELFKKSGISYVSIMPSFKTCDGYECPYFNVLSGGMTPFDRSIASAFSLMQVPSFLNALGIEANDPKASELFRIKAIVLGSVFATGEVIGIRVTGGERERYVLFDGTKGEPECSESDALPGGVTRIAEARAGDARSIIDALSDIAQDRIIERPENHTYMTGDNPIVKGLTKRLRDVGLQELVIQLEALATDSYEKPVGFDKAGRLGGHESAISVVKGLTASHTGGQGIYIARNEKGKEKALSDEELEKELLHELLAGNYALPHEEIASLTDGILRGADIRRMLAQANDKKRNKPLWEMTAEERAGIEERDVSAHNKSLSSPQAIAQFIAPPSSSILLTQQQSGVVTQRSPMRVCAAGDVMNNYIITSEATFREDKKRIYFTAYRRDDPKKQMVEISIPAQRAPPGVFSKETYLRTGDLLNSMIDAFLDQFRGDTLLIEPNEYGIYALGSGESVALMSPLQNNDYAVLLALAGAADVLSNNEFLQYFIDKGIPIESEKPNLLSDCIEKYTTKDNYLSFSEQEVMAREIDDAGRIAARVRNGVISRSNGQAAMRLIDRYNSGDAPDVRDVAAIIRLLGNRDDLQFLEESPDTILPYIVEVALLKTDPDALQKALGADFSIEALDLIKKWRFVVGHLRHVVKCEKLNNDKYNKSFPEEKWAQDILEKPNARVLIIQNIHDGVGDEIARTNIIIRALLRYNKSLTITFYTRLDGVSLYPDDSGRVEVRDIKLLDNGERDKFRKEMEGMDGDIGTYNIVFNFFGTLSYNKDISEWARDSFAPRNDVIYFETQSTTNFKGDEINLLKIGKMAQLDRTRLAEYKPLGSFLPNAYALSRRICQLIGLYEIAEGDDARRIYIDNKIKTAAERWWRAHVGSGTAAIIFNGFGGQRRNKDFPIGNVEPVAILLEKLFEKLEPSTKILMMTTGNITAQYKQDLLSELQKRGVKDGRLIFLPDVRSNALLVNGIIDRSAGVVTTEGVNTHLAAALGKHSLTLIGTKSGRPRAWYPEASQPDQRWVTLDFANTKTLEFSKVDKALTRFVETLPRAAPQAAPTVLTSTSARVIRAILIGLGTLGALAASTMSSQAAPAVESMGNLAPPLQNAANYAISSGGMWGLIIAGVAVIAIGVAAYLIYRYRASRAAAPQAPVAGPQAVGVKAHKARQVFFENVKQWAQIAGIASIFTILYFAFTMAFKIATGNDISLFVSLYGTVGIEQAAIILVIIVVPSLIFLYVTKNWRVAQLLTSFLVALMISYNAERYQASLQYEAHKITLSSGPSVNILIPKGENVRYTLERIDMTAVLNSVPPEFLIGFKDLKTVPDDNKKIRAFNLRDAHVAGHYNLITKSSSVMNGDRGILSHEVGHHIYFEIMTKPQREEWADIYDEYKKGGRHELGEYAEIDAKELFAEAVRHYMEDSDSMRRECPSKMWFFIGKLFTVNGILYLYDDFNAMKISEAYGIPLDTLITDPTMYVEISDRFNYLAGVVEDFKNTFDVSSAGEAEKLIKGNAWAKSRGRWDNRRFYDPLSLADIMGSQGVIEAIKESTRFIQPVGFDSYIEQAEEFNRNVGRLRELSEQYPTIRFYASPHLLKYAADLEIAIDELRNTLEQDSSSGIREAELYIGRMSDGSEHGCIVVKIRWQDGSESVSLYNGDKKVFEPKISEAPTAPPAPAAVSFTLTSTSARAIRSILLGLGALGVLVAGTMPSQAATPIVKGVGNLAPPLQNAANFAISSLGMWGLIIAGVAVIAIGVAAYLVYRYRASRATASHVTPSAVAQSKEPAQDTLPPSSTNLPAPAIPAAPAAAAMPATLVSTPSPAAGVAGAVSNEDAGGYILLQLLKMRQEGGLDLYGMTQPERARKLEDAEKKRPDIVYDTNGIIFIKIAGLFNETRQFAHIGLARTYGRTVVYIDKDIADGTKGAHVGAKGKVEGHEMVEIRMYDDGVKPGGVLSNKGIHSKNDVREYMALNQSDVFWNAFHEAANGIFNMDDLAREIGSAVEQDGIEEVSSALITMGPRAPPAELKLTEEKTLRIFKELWEYELRKAKTAEELDAYNRAMQSTVRHSIYTARLAALIAKIIGLPESDINDITVAAFLHDLGKREILSLIANGELLTDNERAGVTQRHVAVISEIMDKKFWQGLDAQKEEPFSEKSKKRIRYMARTHHEDDPSKRLYVWSDILYIADKITARVDARRPHKSPISDLPTMLKMTRDIVEQELSNATEHRYQSVLNVLMALLRLQDEAVSSQNEKTPVVVADKAAFIRIMNGVAFPEGFEGAIPPTTATPSVTAKAPLPAAAPAGVESPIVVKALGHIHENIIGDSKNEEKVPYHNLVDHSREVKDFIDKVMSHMLNMNILKTGGERSIEVAKIAAYFHDIGYYMLMDGKYTAKGHEFRSIQYILDHKDMLMKELGLNPMEIEFLILMVEFTRFKLVNDKYDEGLFAGKTFKDVSDLTNRSLAAIDASTAGTEVTPLTDREVISFLISIYKDIDITDRSQLEFAYNSLIAAKVIGIADVYGDDSTRIKRIPGLWEEFDRDGTAFDKTRLDQIASSSHFVRNIAGAGRINHLLGIHEQATDLDQKYGIDPFIPDAVRKGREKNIKAADSIKELLDTLKSATASDAKKGSARKELENMLSSSGIANPGEMIDDALSQPVTAPSPDILPTAVLPMVTVVGDNVVCAETSDNTENMTGEAYIAKFEEDVKLLLKEVDEGVIPAMDDGREGKVFISSAAPTGYSAGELSSAISGVKGALNFVASKKGVPGIEFAYALGIEQSYTMVQFILDRKLPKAQVRFIVSRANLVELAKKLSMEVSQLEQLLNDNAMVLIINNDTQTLNGKKVTLPLSFGKCGLEGLLKLNLAYAIEKRVNGDDDSYRDPLNRWARSLESLTHNNALSEEIMNLKGDPKDLFIKKTFEISLPPISVADTEEFARTFKTTIAVLRSL